MLDSYIFFSKTIGLIVVTIFLLFIIIELYFKLVSFLNNKDKDLSKNSIYPKDYYPDQYHGYLDYYQSWEKAMFKYIPIGFRVFNKRNKLLEKHAKINSLGFRTYEFEDKTNEEIRIAILGGSAAFGCGASSNENTISGNLENILKKKYKKNIRIFNLAQINSFQTQDILTINFFFEKIRPDLVIFYNGWNEIISNNIMKDEYINNYNVFNLTELDDWNPPAVNEVKLSNLKDSLYHFLSGKLKFIDYLNFETKNPKRDKYRKSFRTLEDTIAAGSRLYQTNLKIIDKLSKAFNFELINVLQPNMSLKKNLTDIEKKILEYNKLHNNLFESQNFVETLFKTDIYKSLSHLIDVKFNLYDFSKIFDDEKSTTYNTIVHCNDFGYKIVANKINEIIENNEKYKNIFI